MKPVLDADSLDYTVIRFNKDYSIRGRLGTYLTTSIEEVAAENQAPAGNNSLLPAGNPSTALTAKGSQKQHSSKTYLLGVNGQGIGEDIDCLQFVSIDNK